MASVSELSAPYANFMLTPRHGAGVCVRCFNFTDGYELCYACTRHANSFSAVLPISYSVAHEQLHHVLATYKRIAGPVGRRFAVQLAAVLWCYLEIHEACLASAVGVEAFPLVTTVPSGDPARDESHPLRWIVGEAVALTRDRYQRLLRRSSASAGPHAFAADKYRVEHRLSGEPILVIDDTWTTGANAQSAAAALKVAGAGPLAALVIGRHVNREWHQNDDRLRALGRFDWRACALCAPNRVRPNAPV